MGDTGDTDPVLEEDLWTRVHNTNQLTVGSVVKVQESAPCPQYNTYSNIWKSGRFIGYSAINPVASGNFITGATKDHVPNLVIESPNFYNIDGKNTYCCNLKNSDTSLYVNSKNTNSTMLSWYFSPLSFGFDIVDGKASFFKYGSTLTRNGNYVFFYDNGTESGIYTSGATANYAPTWNVYKQYNVIDSTSMILSKGEAGKDLIFYQRSMDQNGKYETIVLPFSLNEQELPPDYSFYQFSGSEVTDHNTVKLHIQPVSTLSAGEAYIMRYTGSTPSLVHRQFEFRKMFETSTTIGNTVVGTYKYLSSTDIDAGKIMFVLQTDGSAFVRMGASDHVSPFRACIITTLASAPEKYEISVEPIIADIQIPLSQEKNEKTDVYTILGQLILRQATITEINQLKNGLYVTKNGKMLVWK
jgi:hypothetical protein